MTGGTFGNQDTCPQPFEYCAKVSNLNMRCRFRAWVWALMIGGPALVIIIIIVIVCMMRRGGN